MLVDDVVTPHVRKHKKAASEARWDTDQAYVALGELHTQMEQVDQQRAATQAARANDQAVLARLREQLEAARAEALIATRQWIQANNLAAMAEAARNNAKALAAQQDCVKRDLRQQHAQTQHMVMDLQHEVHYLNNQLHPILDEEEEDLEMCVEDDSLEEEEVDLEDEDDAISDLNCEHAEEQNHLGTSHCACCIPAICIMDLQFEFQYS